MSAEKEIVNFWYNRNGYFTIHNMKTSSNRDAGILAVKPGSEGNDAVHIQVSCSITGAIESRDIGKSTEKISEDKFYDDSIQETLKAQLQGFSAAKGKNILVLNSLPKARKDEIIRKFREINIEVLEFESIMLDVMQNLDTQYYKSDIIRTLQLAKFLLLSNPEKAAQLLVNDLFSSSSRKEFLSTILDKEEIMREFKRTNTERLSAILKSSGMKPEELAHMLEHDILNKRTRKTFMDSLADQEKIRKVVSRIIKKNKNEMELNKFF
jgi:hypothetical protein